MTTWQDPDPVGAGFAADLDERFDIARAAGCLPNVHGAIALRHGRTVCERYWPGLDEVRGRPLGVVHHGPDVLHDLRSVTKSLVGLAYGIALEGGRVPPPEAILVDQFPEFPDLAVDPARRRITIAHVLSMTMGLEWDELSIPYSDPRNSEIAMDRSPDRTRFVLERPIVKPPGESWTYCGGATALLGRLIAKGTGTPLPDFVQSTLFDPLGITRTLWLRSANGEAIAASGLRLTLRDLARIGAMLLDGGHWNGRVVVPGAWLATAFKPSITLPDGRTYGYHWYGGAIPADDGAGRLIWEPITSAIGYGGQRLFLVPRRGLVVAVFAGNYGSTDQWIPPLMVLRDILLPTLQDR